MAPVRAETTPVHVLVNVCGMEEEALSRCLSVLSEVFMALSFLRHSAVVASVNAIGAGAPVRRPVCSMSSLQSQIDAIKSALPRSPLSHQEGRCSCAQDFGRVAELLLQADSLVLILTSPTHLPETQRLVSLWKASSCRMEMILLRRDDEDIGATVNAIMELVESIAAFPHVSIVQAEDSLLDLRRTMKPWLRRLQSYVPCTIGFKEKPMRLHLILRSAMCFYRDESRASMHAGLGAMTGLHYVPLSSIDGSVVLGYPLHADVEPAPSENADLCMGLQHLLQTKSAALILRCTNNEVDTYLEERHSCPCSSRPSTLQWCPRHMPPRAML
ncbi:hypothetical protein, variant [Saprolegnia diclina VS20]|uniref:Uncharacterized protein n=1 Tax=Saprolegnia diclina (strain VS20) TaxID=1156394 RepID=T0QA90_SAPDV|nr:hypothetical protein, variant [Saprolegnia diclina VS20]EQC34824.1 hypothetical protein, variant [Saprolegnia diclina VS20]|eukprot:XP_008611696.1 hypothetical protein, variant [Saprolegnia diclina VS20]